MGFIIDTEEKMLGLERRRESYYIYSLEEGHIFLYPTPQGESERDNTVEISKVFLKKLIDYFNKHPEELQNIK